MPQLRNNLSVRAKIVFAIVVSVVLLSALVYAIGNAMLFASYGTIEREAVTKDLQRVEDAIGEFTNQQMIKLSDWAAWDEAYRYALERDQAWADATVYATGLANLDINGMIWSDTEGNIFLIKTVDIATREEVSSDALTKYFSAHPELIRHDALDDETRSIVMTAEGPLIVVSLPLRTSEGKGPIPGSLTFVRYLDEGKIADVADITHLDLAAFRYDAPNLPEDVAAAKARLSKANSRSIEPVSDGLVRGYTTVRDANGAPALILRTESPRPIFEQARVTFTLLMSALAAALAAFGIIMLVLIDRAVIARLVRLATDVDQVNLTHNIEVRVAEGEQDEVGKLGGNINRMLGWLIDARAAEASTRREMVNLLDELKKGKEQAEEMARLLEKK